MESEVMEYRVKGVHKKEVRLIAQDSSERQWEEDAQKILKFILEEIPFQTYDALIEAIKRSDPKVSQ